MTNIILKWWTNCLLNKWGTALARWLIDMPCRWCFWMSSKRFWTLLNQLNFKKLWYLCSSSWPDVFHHPIFRFAFAPLNLLHRNRCITVSSRFDGAELFPPSPALPMLPPFLTNFQVNDSKLGTISVKEHHVFWAKQANSLNQSLVCKKLHSAYWICKFELATQNSLKKVA